MDFRLRFFAVLIVLAAVLICDSASAACGPLRGQQKYEACTPVTSRSGFVLYMDGKPLPTDTTLRPSLLVPTVHSLGLFTVMRLTEAWLWPQPFAQTQLSRIAANYRRAFTRLPKWDGNAPPFEWDGDRWQINVIGHGLLGTELYGRARFCRQSPVISLLFATVASGVWEYAFEANGVRPSGMDLWFTPLSGAVVGEFRYWIWRSAESWRAGLGRGTAAALQVLMDPLGEFERGLGARC